MACSSGCPTQDCPSYGACLRRKGLQIDRHALQNDTDARLERAQTNDLNAYRELRENGSQPRSPMPGDVRAAKDLAMKHGKVRFES